MRILIKLNMSTVFISFFILYIFVIYSAARLGENFISAIKNPLEIKSSAQNFFS